VKSGVIVAALGAAPHKIMHVTSEVDAVAAHQVARDIVTPENLQRHTKHLSHSWGFEYFFR